MLNVQRSSVDIYKSLVAVTLMWLRIWLERGAKWSVVGGMRSVIYDLFCSLRIFSTSTCGHGDYEELLIQYPL